ncbi:MAG: hypothetical protein LBR48_09270 [Dysgonamonadaceae bacterium]|jgi:hypothetical protein|nr:hypothetical protein [Dysgonamonadaceae bacterium]
MGKFLSRIFIGALVSFYLFPTGFYFLPAGVNTKMVAAVIGAVAFVLECVPKGGIPTTKQMLGTVSIALFFSFICFYSTDYNRTDDYSYATYIVSFFVWLSAAYGVGKVIRLEHGRFDFTLLTYYLAGVCFAQCVLALMIDEIEPFKNIVDTYIRQGQEFMDEIDRLYGIGASLDPAGIRFSVVLILISVLLCHSDYVRSRKKVISALVISFFVIAVVGNMIARTTSVGALMALGYFVMFSGILSLTLKGRYFKFYFIFSTLLIAAVIVSAILYNVDETFHKHLRFAFEGFFSWVETGEWSTSSTDKLNTMWIWPEDTKTWLIGSGIFGHFIYSTDIGYCRFILYCGIIGFSSFALFFIYNAVSFWRRNREIKWLFIFLLALTFIIWLKVATDIFFIYALFYSLDSFDLSYRNRMFNVDRK